MATRSPHKTISGAKEAFRHSGPVGGASVLRGSMGVLKGVFKSGMAPTKKRNLEKIAKILDDDRRATAAVQRHLKQRGEEVIGTTIQKIKKK